jgi:hypothetical protein
MLLLDNVGTHPLVLLVAPYNCRYSNMDLKIQGTVKLRVLHLIRRRHDSCNVYKLEWGVT